MDTIDIIENKTRLTLQRDADPLNPRTDIETPVGCFRPLGAYRPFDGPPTVHKVPPGLGSAHEQLWDHDRDVDPEHGVILWAEATHGLALVYELGSYWFCDSGAWDLLIGREFTLANQAEIVRHEIDAWRRFCRHEAVVVTLERRATFKRIRPSGVDETDLLHVWEKVDDIADVYLDDYEGSYARVVSDHFAHLLGKKERTTIQAMLDQEATERSLSS